MYHFYTIQTPCILYHPVSTNLFISSHTISYFCHGVFQVHLPKDSPLSAFTPFTPSAVSWSIKGNEKGLTKTCEDHPRLVDVKKMSIFQIISFQNNSKYIWCPSETSLVFPDASNCITIFGFQHHVISCNHDLSWFFSRPLDFCHGSFKSSKVLLTVCAIDGWSALLDRWKKATGASATSLPHVACLTFVSGFMTCCFDVSFVECFSFSENPVVLYFCPCERSFPQNAMNPS